MQILIVDGNTAEGNLNAKQIGMRPYCETYAALMETLNDNVEASIVHPSEIDYQSIKGHNSWFQTNNLDDYDGFVWTGSPLNLYNDCCAIQNQRAFGEAVLKTGKPIFGSCWGLQINAELLGGKVIKNPKGREIGIARNICVNEKGANHPIYANKPKCFNALAIHLDIVSLVPDGAEVLAHNGYSEVQAMVYDKAGVDFWGVQYHPEFNLNTLAFIYSRISTHMVEEGFCQNQADVDSLVNDFKLMHDSIGEGKTPRKDLFFRYGLTECVTSSTCHNRELVNWLDHVSSLNMASS